MDAQTLSNLGQRFGQFLGGFFACFTNRPAFDNFLAYCQALAGELENKSVEPIAQHAGKGVRAMQCFLTQSPWDDARLRDQLQQHVAQYHCPAPDEARGRFDLAIGVIDETSDQKYGPKTPGVQRQYLGTIGKVDNGIVTVHLGFERDGFSTLLDGELFLPEKWANDGTAGVKRPFPMTWRIAPSRRSHLNRSTGRWRTGCVLIF